MVEMYRIATLATPGGWVEKAFGVVSCGTPRGTLTTNMAMVHDATDVGHLEAATARAFVQRRQPFSIWTREHADRSLIAALEEAGFAAFTTVPAMAYHADASPEPPTAGLTVRAVETDGDRAAFCDVMIAAWGIYGLAAETIGAFFERLEALQADDVQGFVGWQGREPVSGAILYHCHDVAGVGWVGTVPSASRAGFGGVVTAAVVRAGLERGARFASLQASPMGAPVYERLGFETVSHYRVFLPHA